MNAPRLTTRSTLGDAWLQPSALTVSLTVLLFYALVVLIALGRYEWNPLWFVWVGERFEQLEPNGRLGYDGQFVYYIARDGWAATEHLDTPAYRLQRIGYPALVRMLTAGNDALIPWAMIVINLLAIALTTFLLAEWLGAHDTNPWYALIYSLYVGTFFALSRDLTEPLAFLFVTAGVILWCRRAYALAVPPLAVAVLTKETTILFIAALAIAVIIQKRPRSLVYLALAMLPLALWQLSLFATFGENPVTSGPSLSMWPLGGIVPQLSSDAGRLSAFLFVGVPSVILALLAAFYLVETRGRAPVVWWLLLNSLFVLLLPLDVYDHIVHAGRNAAGLILALVFVLPLIHPRMRQVAFFYCIVPTFIWLLPALRWAPWLSDV